MKIREGCKFAPTAEEAARERVAQQGVMAAWFRQAAQQGLGTFKEGRA